MNEQNDGQKMYTVQELMNRYQLKSRTTLYNWCNQLSLTLESSGRKSYATPEQVQKLDDFKVHLDDGGTFNNYVLPSDVRVMDTKMNDSEDVTIEQPLDNKPLTVQSPMDRLADLTSTLLPPNTKWLKEAAKELDPLWAHRILTEVEDFQVILTTTEVSKLIDVRPHGDVFIRGSWKFTKSGRIGRESGWKITKIM